MIVKVALVHGTLDETSEIGGEELLDVVARAPDEVSV